jgi:hypothetical protein
MLSQSSATSSAERLALFSILKHARAFDHCCQPELMSLLTRNVRFNQLVHQPPEAAASVAAVTAALAAEGIPCNVVAAFHHDHLFVTKSESFFL